MPAPPRFKHGTRYGYRKAKCRCGLCRKWRREDGQRERRA